MQNENSTFAPPSNTPAAVPEDYISELVGEDKKYKTVEDLAKGTYHAQAHITTLERESAEQQAKLAKAATIEEILAGIDQNRANPPAQPPSIPDGQTQTPATTEAQVPLEKQSIEGIVQSYMESTQKERVQQDNFTKSLKAIDFTYGSREAANQAVAKKANELGVKIEWLQDMAKQSSEAFLKLMGNSDGQSAPEKPVKTPSGFRTSNFNNSSSEIKPGTYRFYQKLRKESPHQYHRQYSKIMAEAAKDPDKFYERT